MSALPMGRGAVWVSATGWALVAALQLCGVDVSTSLGRFGGRVVDIAWGVTLVAAWVALTWSLVVARDSEDEAIRLERVGAVCLVCGVGIFALAIMTVNPIIGSLVVLQQCATLSLNVTGRQVLQWLAARRLVRHVTEMRRSA